MQHIVTDVSVLNKFNTDSDHRLVRAEIRINMRLERAKLMRKKTTNLNLDKLHQHSLEFQLALQNKFDVLEDTMKECELTETSKVIAETINSCVREVAGKEFKKKEDKLSETTLKLLTKRREMKQQNNIQKMQNHHETNEGRLREHNVKKIEQTLEAGRSYKRAKQALTLSLGRSQMVALQDEDGKVITDRDGIVSRVEHFYQDLYSRRPTYSHNQ
ncbi:uncharacterized protein [Amphiura filiformis]|uniref:uncharacterized protein n=1 Tax=Amphiura filiformis TaxID=82378 RepID=UPI003B21D9FD